MTGDPALGKCASVKAVYLTHMQVSHQSWAKRWLSGFWFHDASPKTISLVLLADRRSVIEGKPVLAAVTCTCG
jgi:hypothetical protein